MEQTINLTITLDEFCSCVDFTEEQKKGFGKMVSEAKASFVIESAMYVILGAYAHAKVNYLEFLHGRILEDHTYGNVLNFDNTCRLVLRQLIPASQIVFRQHIEDPDQMAHDECKTALSELVLEMKQIIEHFLRAQDLLLDWFESGQGKEDAGGPEVNKSEE